MPGYHKQLLFSN